MARPREFDKEAALDNAMQLFWDKGYEAASMNELAEIMGIQKPSIYAAFGDKKSLFESALRRYNQQHAQLIRSRLQQQKSVRASFRYLFEQLVHDATVREHSRGCFCINTLVELAPHDPRFKILTREHQMYLVAVFQEYLNRGVVSGELGAEMNVEAVSKTLMLHMIGLTVILKGKPEASWVEQSIAAIMVVME
ncbi:TetR/AcrR family transcriptional regulator [Paenibacillus bovis]|uniref:Transcriptional regulator n=1 Tax=Paenibacillus bovis TaxID=1616788 RepID=A0A172ZH68_9BACL|nr:TetR/AcrR family transcriptional regulator [Paenibacillus bovis]ANF96984.1 transcriptional regulator [Paenibacillus bovis]